jgi:type II secretory pathway pseudopilin PulG
MSLEKQDLQKLQTPLLILAVVIVMVISVFGAAQYFNQNQELALQNQQNLLNAARQRYQLSGAEKDMIVEYLPKYQMLISKGFVGEEQRIEWVEYLREQHNKQKLFGIKYSISPQEKYTPPFAANLGGFTLNRSVMKLELDMLHEGDLLLLTEALSTDNSAPFVVRDCEINKLNPGSPLSNQLIANLHAQCELDWLTLREPATVQVSSAP